jgi:hypothetical protein
MDSPAKLSASELRTMLKDHKKSMPRLSSKKPELMEYATRVGLLKAAEKPLPPSPPTEAAPVEKKKPTTAAAPASTASKKAALPEELKKPVDKKVVDKKKAEPPAPAKKAFSEGAKNALAAYSSFIAEKKARGMSHKEAQEAWKGRRR